MDYGRARHVEDLKLWALACGGEVDALVCDDAYSTFTWQIRARGLRPHCEARLSDKGTLRR